MKNFLAPMFGGRNARLENESDLIFKTEYFDENAPNEELIGKRKSFIVESAAPLKIDLPLLGYSLQFDLITFSKIYNSEFKDYEIHILGYYFYQSYEQNSRIKANKYARNRLDVYYNSAQHFCRSLYDKQLHKNGFLVFEFFE